RAGWAPKNFSASPFRYSSVMPGKTAARSLPPGDRLGDGVLVEALVDALACAELLRLLAELHRLRLLALLREDLSLHPVVPPGGLQGDGGVDELGRLLQVTIALE